MCCKLLQENAYQFDDILAGEVGELGNFAFEEEKFKLEVPVFLSQVGQRLVVLAHGHGLDGGDPSAARVLLSPSGERQV